MQHDHGGTVCNEVLLRTYTPTTMAAPGYRDVPLPERTLTRLREYWVTHRNPKWLFPVERLASDGNYYYVDTLSEALQMFVENLTGTLQVIAKAAKAQVDYNPEVMSHYRLIGYENRDVADEDFRGRSGHWRGRGRPDAEERATVRLPSPAQPQPIKG